MFFELVLLDSNFASMPKIVAEGRRNINNIERSASLLLVKTIYTILLILTCIATNVPLTATISSLESFVNVKISRI